MNPTIGISGKRYIKNNQVAVIEENLRHFIDKILAGNKKKKFVGISMLAAGADSLFASMVVSVYKMPLHVVLPFPIAEYKKDFTSEEIETFEKLLSQASEVIIVSKKIPANNQEKSLAYLEAGFKIADQANEMIVVWDDQKPSGQGGTADILSYFAETNPAEKIHLINTDPKKRDDLQYNMDAAFRESNDVSIANRKSHDKVWRWSIFLGWLAVGCFAIKTGYEIREPNGYIFTTIETALILSVVLIIWNARKRGFHKNYLKKRLKAEQLRVLLRYYQIGIAVDVPIFAEEKDDDLTNFIDDINKESTSNSYKSKWYANYVIKDLITDQKKYHRNKIIKMKGKPKVYELIKKSVTVAFMANLGIHFLLSLAHHLEYIGEPPHYFEHISTVLSIFLPATYAAIEGILTFEGWEKIKVHSEVVLKTLEKSEERIPKNLKDIEDSACYAEQINLTKEIATTMLNDNTNWQIIVADKANYQVIL